MTKVQLAFQCPQTAIARPMQLMIAMEISRCEFAAPRLQDRSGKWRSRELPRYMKSGLVSWPCGFNVIDRFVGNELRIGLWSTYAPQTTHSRDGHLPRIDRLRHVDKAGWATGAGGSPRSLLDRGD